MNAQIPLKPIQVPNFILVANECKIEGLTSIPVESLSVDTINQLVARFHADLLTKAGHGDIVSAADKNGRSIS